MGGMCEKLKWNRKRLGLSQKEYAALVGVHVGTINRLEADETKWSTMRDETYDRITSTFENMASWQPENAGEVLEDIAVEREVVEDERTQAEIISVALTKKNDGLNDEEKQDVAVVKFICDSLSEAKVHEEFVTYIKLLKRIVNKY